MCCNVRKQSQIRMPCKQIIMRPFFQKFGKHWKRREHSIFVSNWRSQRTFPHIERNQSDIHSHQSYLKKWQLSHVIQHLIKYLLALLTFEWIQNSSMSPLSCVTNVTCGPFVTLTAYVTCQSPWSPLNHLWDLCHSCQLSSTSVTWITFAI